MVPKNGSRLPKSQIPLSEAEFARVIGVALQSDLGASHRAAKSVMAWTGVSNRTAWSWLNGVSSPTGRHLVMLSARCRPVMTLVLKLAGHGNAVVALDLLAVEVALEGTLRTLQEIRNAR